jgi:hypothetical protein
MLVLAPFETGKPLDVSDLDNQRLTGYEGPDLLAGEQPPADPVQQYQLALRLAADPLRYSEAIRWAKSAADQGHVSASALLVDIGRALPPFRSIVLGPIRVRHGKRPMVLLQFLDFAKETS